MKLGYFGKMLGYQAQNSCNDYSCSPPAGANEKAGEFRIQPSKYNIPFDLIEINEDAVVVNIVSGLGYEILKASEKTGTNGKVIGVDFSPAMMYRARYNVEKTGCKNVFFREVFSRKFLPLGANVTDILIFNKLLNKVPIKNLFSEIYRILKPGGVFYIYDNIAGCPDCSNASSKNSYIQILNAFGFKDVIIREFTENTPADEYPSPKNLKTALIRGEK
ncbi:MAG: methyltransferase domain-containing protein [Prevotellaceae bacterium]|jgi:ubiquinone/menaquinone biosynthesis C-methylase UbiE|nr:methyltransferase domain-containing protein [Prevotellaceae bacterium]